LWIGAVASSAKPEVVEFELYKRFNEKYVLDITLTSISRTIEPATAVPVVKAF
jgi:hypothetical protein